MRSDDDGDHDDHENENGNANDDKNGNADDDDDDLGDRDGIPSGPEPVRRTSRRPFKAESSHASQYYLSLVNIIYHRFMMIELMKIDFIFGSSRHDENELSR